MFLEEFKEGHYPERTFETDNISGKNKQDSSRANTPLRVLTATSIIGDKIQNSQGEHLGTVKDLMIDVTLGCIDYLVIEFGGLLGFGEKLFAIDINTKFEVGPGVKDVNSIKKFAENLGIKKLSK